MPNYTLHHGDCLDVMAALDADSIDTIITDPPYGMKFMGKRWDYGVPTVPYWEAALRVAKPGAFMLAFGGTRTHHRLMCAIEDAGWELHECLIWLYAQGFPKNRNFPKLDMEGEQAKEWEGWGTALKPAWEPIIVAMKPLDGTFAQNAERHGVAGLSIDAARIEGDAGSGVWGSSNATVERDRTFNASPDDEDYRSEKHPAGRWPANVILDEEAGAMLDEQSGDRVSRFFFCAVDSGLSTPYIYKVDTPEGGQPCGQEKTEGVDTCAGKNTESRSESSKTGGCGNKPMALFLPDTISITETATSSIMTFPIWNASSGSFTGIITIEYESPTSTLTASNIASVRSAENGSVLIVTSDGEQVPIRGTARLANGWPYGNGEKRIENTSTNTCGNTASPSRAFYCAKASRSERNAGVGGSEKPLLWSSGKQNPGSFQSEGTKKAAKNNHPTVKPVELLRYLCRLTATPTGGTVLDPFMGSGSTGVACAGEGRPFVGIELDAEYVEIAQQRIEAAYAQE